MHWCAVAAIVVLSIGLIVTIIGTALYVDFDTKPFENAWAPEHKERMYRLVKTVHESLPSDQDGFVAYGTLLGVERHGVDGHRHCCHLCSCPASHGHR